MKFQTILTPECTQCAISGSSKKRILEKVCALAVQKIPHLSAQEILESLMVREKMGSTGIGKGIAIPHGRLSGTTEVVCVLVTTKQGIDFDSIDSRPVDIFIALFVPEANCKEHLSTLQSIAQLFDQKAFCKQIRKCKTNQELYDFIQQHD